jgi:hypothetical protein
MSGDKENDFAITGPMQISPWERCLPPGKNDMHAYYADLACRIKIAIILGLMLTCAMLWTKLSPVRMENRLAESRFIAFLCGEDAFYANLNPSYPATCLLAPIPSDGGIPSDNEAHAESVQFR